MVGSATGALGRGLGAIGDDGRSNRQHHAAATDAGQGMINAGEAVAGGLWDGVTGVFTKPVEGAMKDGVGGFVGALPSLVS